MKFNENLKYLRKKEGLTQEELAERLNVSRQSVTKWESGQSLPDIEKVKEIAYMFSVSMDALVGDIDSKIQNRMKKKIDNIVWFILGFSLFLIIVISSIYNVLLQTIKDEDLIYSITILMVFIALIFFTVALESYIKNRQDIILNMKDTKEGKNERVKYIVKQYITSIVLLLIFTPVVKLGVLVESTKIFIIESIKLVVIGLVIFTILAIKEYINLEKKVKEINKE